MRAQPLPSLIGKTIAIVLGAGYFLFYLLLASWQALFTIGSLPGLAIAAMMLVAGLRPTRSIGAKAILAASMALFAGERLGEQDEWLGPMSHLGEWITLALMLTPTFLSLAGAVSILWAIATQQRQMQMVSVPVEGQRMNGS